jgi:hypothetical protein
MHVHVQVRLVWVCMVLEKIATLALPSETWKLVFVGNFASKYRYIPAPFY